MNTTTDKTDEEKGNVRISLLNKLGINRTALIWWAVFIVIGSWWLLWGKPVSRSGSVARIANQTVNGEAKKPAAGDAVLAAQLQDEVVPVEGYEVPIIWGDTGVKLVRSGAIDLEKFKQNYTDEQYRELLAYLTAPQQKGITITRDNAYFWVNTLWALGLTQQSDVLSKGIMSTQYKDKIGNFASTGGWTLGKKEAVELFSSADIVPLTAQQQELVAKVSANIYRPCCGNSTAFPDCNHGMAILGLLELMASQGMSEADMYRASLAFNSYWFTQTYMDLDYYFRTKQDLAWADIDPKLLLSNQYSSGTGYQAIKQEIGNAVSLPSSGGSCGA
ncbi:MAG: hypothetical protein U1C49_01410 [Candidatus Andersenbacteria bacterium]|nr:hypothetical protein [bacterium]MDZ4225484.1 hypothetical protein [Candidatus Andersenbacteria bacterium]